MPPTASHEQLDRQFNPALKLARRCKRPGELKIVVSAVVLDGNRIVMIREGHGRKRGCWNLPGGKLQADEKMLAAAVRETQEETGYHIKPLGLLAMYPELRREGRPSLRVHIAAEVIGGRMHCDGDEVLEVGWFDVDYVQRMTAKKLWNAHYIHRTLREMAEAGQLPLKLLGELDAAMAVA